MRWAYNIISWVYDTHLYKGLAKAPGSTTQHGLLTAARQTDMYH